MLLLSMFVLAFIYFFPKRPKSLSFIISFLSGSSFFLSGLEKSIPILHFFVIIRRYSREFKLEYFTIDNSPVYLSKKKEILDLITPNYDSEITSLCLSDIKDKAESFVELAYSLTFSESVPAMSLSFYQRLSTFCQDHPLLMTIGGIVLSLTLCYCIGYISPAPKRPPEGGSPSAVEPIPTPDFSKIKDCYLAEYYYPLAFKVGPLRDPAIPFNPESELANIHDTLHWMQVGAFTDQENAALFRDMFGI
jgi:hypothetical protein